MPGIRRLVLDVDIPSSVSIVELAQRISGINGVKSVNITVTDTDVEVLGLVIIIEGDDVDYDRVRGVIEDLGGAIRSIDQVIAGEYIVELDQRFLRER
ncbi:DUF211 domain-containing protein [Vulcanisaeta thermophila]|uniref:DUF211 domain-containing protein n=1 Tax=Vulcanisaeta thermophila TaxID=867917 RepID=UPI000852D8F8|nr:DUF211 domain-containing protein [Vulcanisaeta thermophila]